jgi:hypothetical protein
VGAGSRGIGHRGVPDLLERQQPNESPPMPPAWPQGVRPPLKDRAVRTRSSLARADVTHSAASTSWSRVTAPPSRPKERPDDQPEQDWRPHQLSTACAAADPLSEARSASPMNAAGAAAYPPEVRGPSRRAHQSRLGCTRRLVRQVDLETGPRCDTRAPVAETASQSSASSDSGRICPPSTTIV